MAQPAEIKSEIPENLQDRVGHRIAVDTFKGTIRYVGTVATSKKASTTWLGIEWDDANRGKNDGSVKTQDGKVHRYFTTDEGRASFIKPAKANFGRDLLAVILDRFSLDSLEDDIKEQQKIAQESAYKIEFVGWDKSIRRQCNLKQKLSVNIEDYDVTHIDMRSLQQLKETIPEVQSLELRRNLISSLHTFTALSAMSHTLIEINLSHNPLNCLTFQSIASLSSAFAGTFANLQCLYLNNTKSKTFKPWQFVYILAMNGCLPKLRELQLCVNDINHLRLPMNIINNEMAANPNAFGADESKLSVPNGAKIAEIFAHLQDVNIGENPMSDWVEIGDVFGYCPNLTHVQCSYMAIERIVYRQGVFTALARLWMRNNLWNDVSVFDELNKFPNLHQLSFVQNTFEDKYGFSTLRDLAIAKIANLRVCNASLVNANERCDAELFYLKWIAKQIANDDDKSDEEEEEDKDEEAEESRIDQLYPRYIELRQKHGVMNLDTEVEERLMAVTVIIQSMDPESITVKPIEKKLPTAMTVAQLKLLCKRYFQLNPQYQRLMYRKKGGLPDDMYDDTRTLSFYNIKDGMEILMQSSNFDRKK